MRHPSPVCISPLVARTGISNDSPSAVFGCVSGGLAAGMGFKGFVIDQPRKGTPASVGVPFGAPTYPALCAASSPVFRRWASTVPRWLGRGPRRVCGCRVVVCWLWLLDARRRVRGRWLGRRVCRGRGPSGRRLGETHPPGFERPVCGRTVVQPGMGLSISAHPRPRLRLLSPH